jgi:hypothetical protein
MTIESLIMSAAARLGGPAPIPLAAPSKNIDGRLADLTAEIDSLERARGALVGRCL